MLDDADAGSPERPRERHNVVYSAEWYRLLVLLPDIGTDADSERGTNRWTNGSADRGTDERAERLAHDGRPHRPGGHAGANERADVRADTCSDALVPRCG